MFIALNDLAYSDPEKLHQAPVKTPVTRLDEVGAARHPVLKYEFEESVDADKGLMISSDPYV